MPYNVVLDEYARERFLALDKSVREKIARKLLQLERDDLVSRHLKHGVPTSVGEVGQYRIVFKTIEGLKEKRVIFVGDHKNYAEWLRQQQEKES